MDSFEIEHLNSRYVKKKKKSVIHISKSENLEFIFELNCC